MVLAINSSCGIMDDFRRVRTPAQLAMRGRYKADDLHSSYLIIAALYDKDPQLKFSKGVLTVFVVALMTAGYSFTALLCFACRNKMFQAEAIFL